MFETKALPVNPQDGYEVLRAEAVGMAGAPGDIARRVMVHHFIYRDSGGNHAFPLVALHGALWAAGFFETTGRLGDALRLRYFYNASEREFRMTLLSGFAEGFKTVNRQVFIDTFTNYFYTKHYGENPAAGGALHPTLFSALNSMHAATRSGRSLAAMNIKRAVRKMATKGRPAVPAMLLSCLFTPVKDSLWSASPSVSGA